MEQYQQQTFFNPTVPFCTLIHGQFLDGTMITVSGEVLPNSDRFMVEFQYGYDVVLHFNPRYKGGSGNVVHNTYQNGYWGSEEIKYETPFPRGQLFALQILITLSSYKISTNGKPFSEYNHRMPFSWVDRICVFGMVDLSLVAIQPHDDVPPGSFVVPYKSIMYGGIKPEKIIIIQGFIKPNGNRIELNLRHKTGIAFYYRACLDEKMVVCNSYEDGTWGEEETSDIMLFHRGESILVTIICGRHHYTVFVNGQQTQTYNHRFTILEEIDVLEISGDVELSFVHP